MKLNIFYKKVLFMSNLFHIFVVLELLFDIAPHPLVNFIDMFFKNFGLTVGGF